MTRLFHRSEQTDQRAEDPVSFDDLVGFHERGRKPPGSWRIGLEVEKFGLDSKTSRPLPYEGGAASVRSVLEFLAGARPSRPFYERENLIALEGDWGTITLEPGGQIEWSSPALSDFMALRAALDEHLDLLRQAGEALGVRWLELALQPEASLAEMPWMPKKRYRIMREYFLTRGPLAHNMMTQTTSAQVSVDYADEADWREKFRAGFLLAPLAVAAFANSRRMEGRDTGYASFRSHIWRQTDDDRCGAPAFVFQEEFGFADWVSYMLDVPMMVARDGVEIEPAGGASFRRLLAGGGKGPPLTMLDWELHLTEVFTEARTKTYVELRSTDLPPDRLIPAAPAFWMGLLYDGLVRDRAFDLVGWGKGRRPRPDEWRLVMEETARNGAAARINGRRIGEVLDESLALARGVLAGISPEAERALGHLAG